MKKQIFGLVILWLYWFSFSCSLEQEEDAFVPNESTQASYRDDFRIDFEHEHNDDSTNNIAANQNGGRVHKCQHNKINHPTTQANVNYNDHPYDDQRRLASSSYENIRITPYWTQLEADLASNATLLAYVKQLISASFRYFEGMIKVKRVDGNLYVPRSCYMWYNSYNGYENCVLFSNQCGEVTIPDSHLDSAWLYYYPSNYSATELPQGNGIEDTDLVIYVSSNDSTCDDGVLAWATACSQDQYGRPVAGAINFCASSLASNEWRQDIDVTIHELTHVLVMSPGLWDDFRYENGTSKSEDSVYTVISNQTYIITDKVKESAQSHYNCTSLVGLPIEDDGSSGSAGSHWEEHYLQSEYMCAVIYSSLTYISTFTLALMEDSGWYKVNYSYDEPFVYGINEGCSFFTKDCIDSTTEKSNFPDYYCESTADDGCTYDNTAVGYCLMYSYDSISPSEYDYFSDDTGGSEYSEYCPFRVGQTTSSWTNICWDSYGNSLGISSISNYSLNSRCVDTKNTSTGVEKGYCLNHQCYGYNDVTDLWSGVYISVGSEIVNCTRANQDTYKYLSSKKLNVTCPNIDQICITSKPFQCQWGYYDDTYSKCICSPGYTGTYCTIADNSTIVSGVVLGEANTGTDTFYCPTVTVSNNIKSFLNGIYVFDSLLYSDIYPSYKYNNKYDLYYNIFVHQWQIGNKTSRNYYSYCETESETIWGIDDCTWFTYDSTSGDFFNNSNLILDVGNCTVPTPSPTSPSDENQAFSLLWNHYNIIAFVITIILSVTL